MEFVTDCNGTGYLRIPVFLGLDHPIQTQRPRGDMGPGMGPWHLTTPALQDPSLHAGLRFGTYTHIIHALSAPITAAKAKVNDQLAPCPPRAVSPPKSDNGIKSHYPAVRCYYQCQCTHHHEKHRQT